METPKKMILALWVVAAVLGLALIIFTRPRQGSEKLTADQEMQKAIVGRWQATHETDEFSADGTFVFSIVNETGQQRAVSGKYNFPEAKTLQLAPEGTDKKIDFTDFTIQGETMSLKSKDGKTAVYHRMAAAEVVKPKAEPDRLKALIPGTWQSSGKTETDEWSDDGRMVIRTAQGRTIAFRYEVVDSSHVQVTREGANKAGSPWTVTIKGDAMTVDANNGNGPAVVAFTRIKSDLAQASPLPSVERQISPRPPPVQPAAQQARKVDAGQLKKLIVGKWQHYGGKEIDEWSDDGTVVIINDVGKKLECAYHMSGPNGVMIIPAGSSPIGSPIWSLEIDGDLLAQTRATDDGPETGYFVRLDAKGQPKPVTIPTPGPAVDRSTVVGSWNSPIGEHLVLSQDGSFVFGEAKGQWGMENGNVMARSTNNSTIWKLRLSPDGHSLTGHWSGRVRGAPVAMALTLTR